MYYYNSQEHISLPYNLTLITLSFQNYQSRETTWYIFKKLPLQVPKSHETFDCTYHVQHHPKNHVFCCQIQNLRNIHRSPTHLPHPPSSHQNRPPAHIKRHTSYNQHIHLPGHPNFFYAPKTLQRFWHEILLNERQNQIRPFWSHMDKRPIQHDKLLHQT